MYYAYAQCSESVVMQKPVLEQWSWLYLFTNSVMSFTLLPFKAEKKISWQLFHFNMSLNEVSMDFKVENRKCGQILVL